MATVSNANLIAGLYVAFFNRAPDAEGLSFWLGQFNAGATVRNLAAGFAGHPVFEATYGGMNNQQFVEAVYVNMLGAAGDTTGISHWVGQLNGGQLTRDQMVADFVYSALSADLDAARASGQLTQAEYDVAVQRQQTITNKTNIGVMFAQQLGETTNLAPGTDPQSKASLEADLSYRSAQAIIASINADGNSMTQSGNLILSAAEFLAGQNSSSFTLVAMDDSRMSYAGRDGAPDIYLFNSNNFDNGDTVRLTDFERMDQLILGTQYGHRNKAPSQGDNTMLEVFVEQKGSNVLMTVERNMAGTDVVKIEILGVTVEEIVPTGNFLP
ncbi:MAG: DUF4214 domain-containing protein [Spongiibacteraceae bacterium]|jgi:hypothetical protein|nr:DUF4214 domain-containing protein [Spongiibacteraceae bacterium]